MKLRSFVARSRYAIALPLIALTAPMIALTACEEFRLSNDALIAGADLTAPVRFTEIGGLGGEEQFGTAVNERGLVVGIAEDADRVLRAFTWTVDGGIVQLEDLGAVESRALGVNDNGVACGAATPPDEEELQACVWDENGAFRFLPNLGGGRSLAFGVSNDNQIAGMSVDQDANERAVMWTQDDEIVPLGTLGQRSQSNAINNQNVIVGFFLSEDGSSRGFRWTFQDGMTDIGTLGGNAAEANAIDDLGRMAGRSNFSQNGPLVGFITDTQGRLRDAGTLGGTGSQVLVITENDIIAGVSANAAFAAKSFFGILGRGDIVQLPDHGIPNGNAVRGGNRAGLLVGSVNNSQRRSRAVIWQVGR